MRITTKLLASAAAAAALVVVAGTPALADPPTGTTPAPADVVGVGSDTIQNVFNQISQNYNSAHATGSKLYSWNATDPSTGAVGGPIVTKSGCASIPRPNGSSAGITALTTGNGTTSGKACIDFARSSRGRNAADPTTISFVTLGADAVTYSTEKGSHAPTNLTTADLTGIYNCTITNWSTVGGKPGTIKPFLPQTGSGTRAFFLSAIGVASPGNCVTSTVEENEGINPALHNSNVVFPFSVADYIAQGFHSAKCLNSSCTPVGGVICNPGKGQNSFGCAENGPMILNDINGTAPTTGTGSSTVLNQAGFSPTFQRFVYEVVKAKEGKIPGYLNGFFGPKGWVCTSGTAKQDIAHYGFGVLPAGTAVGDCGHAG